MVKLNKTKQNYQFIIMAICSLTKYIEEKALKSISSSEIINFLEKRIFLRHGIPRIVISDNGTQFVSEETKNYLINRKITPKKTSIYNPKANGRIERANKTIKKMISHFVNKKHNNWHEILSYVVFAYNVSYHESTKFSPFNLVYGREPLIPTDISLSGGQIDNINDIDAKVLYEKLNYARQLALDNIKNAQVKQMQYFNKKRKQIEFSKGDLVLINTPKGNKTGKTKKFIAAWHGPYRVVMQLNDNSYEIETLNSKTNKIKSKIIHVEHMKPFIKPIFEFSDRKPKNFDIQNNNSSSESDDDFADDKIKDPDFDGGSDSDDTPTQIRKSNRIRRAPERFDFRSFDKLKF